MKKVFNKYLRLPLILIVIFSNIGCDQISKKIVRENIDPNEIIEVIDDNLILTKVENTGAALSIGSNLSPNLKVLLLQFLPTAVMLFMVGMTIQNKAMPLATMIAFCFIIGGGAGNIYDRILYGSVTDFVFIDIGIFRTGIFNIADVSVFIGTLIILGSFLWTKKPL